ncbi:hypothetical protein G6O67_001484 [Ophiocordyceps sinensis]|uniref:Uncharacterized protein n=2 Tax=Ophiocordyceps sinensis TaxID=72228 RepID=A0A8H4V8V4_9HYPO|nr:hypothetical protein OCS_02145 [Ophiocordyceps sinensis CO18]KAF4512327.1 hypothetical protein G6O67_001484 [Ophiocordyceps sinensis]
MPSKGNPSIWHDAPFLGDLALVLYEAAYQTGGLTPRINNSVEETLRQQGHEVTWEAIRPNNCRSREQKMSRQTMRWGPEVHEDILITLFQHINLASSDWAKVMDDLRDKGYTFTESALRQHVQKLRKGRDLSGVANAAGGGGTPTKTTPSKAGGRGRKTPSKRGNKELTPVEDDEEVKNLKREAPDVEIKKETPKNKRFKAEPVPEPVSDDCGDEI